MRQEATIDAQPRHSFDATFFAQRGPVALEVHAIASRVRPLGGDSVAERRPATLCIRRNVASDL